MYFVQIVNEGVPGALYEAGDDYQLATLLLAKVLVKNGIAITPEVVECIDDDGSYDDEEGKVYYVVSSEEFEEEEPDTQEPGYSIKDGALYHTMYPNDSLGEFDEAQDFEFVPSKFLLELPPDCHRLVEEYLKSQVD